MVFSFVAGHAGGLALAPLAAIAGGVGIAMALYGARTDAIKTALDFRAQSEWLRALFLFLAWAALSSFWSPQAQSGFPNVLKLVLGVILFEAGRRAIHMACADSSFRKTTYLQNIMIYWPIIAALVLCLDLVTGFSLSFAIDPIKAGESAALREGDAIMNTANGIVWLTICSASALTLMLWTRYRGPIFCVFFLALILISALLNGLSAAIIAIGLSVLFMTLAAFYPARIINILTGAAIGLVGFAPLLSGIAYLTSDALRAAMPFSWEHRLVTWDYIGERIREHPIIGHGFDASRTFDASFDARGFTDLAVVSLHPHNAGLHIWVETGVIGAVLGSTTLFLIGREAQKYAAGGRARAIAAVGTIVPLMIFASVSYGVWQHWWWASFFLSAAFLSLIPRTKPVIDP
jgi:O-antigen ligase